jgi:hypothetical protein
MAMYGSDTLGNIARDIASIQRCGRRSGARRVDWSISPIGAMAAWPKPAYKDFVTGHWKSLRRSMGFTFPGFPAKSSAN